MEKIIRDTDTGDYIVEGGDIHVDDNGISYLIKDGRVIGKNPARILPEVVIKPKANTPWKAAYLQSKRNPNWRSTYDMNPDMETFNAVTGGIFNQLSPTQVGRNIYNIATNKPTAAQEFVFGNNGLFSDKFAEKHPVASTIGNMAADILTLGSTRIPKINRKVYLRIPRNPNRYYRTVASSNSEMGDAIKDANITGYLRSNSFAHPESDNIISLKPRRFEINIKPKRFTYLMFSKGKPWEGSTNGAGAFGKLDGGQRVIRSKQNTGNIIWEESNKDFRHKGHKGIFRPNYNCILEVIPSHYFKYFERGSGPISKHLWFKKDFNQSKILQSRNNIMPRTTTDNASSRRIIPDLQSNF